MIDRKTCLGIIPARGGSRGLPGKNIIPVLGKPLIAYTIEAAKQSRYLDRLILTSDDDAIIQTAVAYGCEAPFKRSHELAKDDTPGIEPVLDVIRRYPEYDYIILLQPTSPLRTAEDIDGCIERCHTHQGQTCVSVSEAEISPYWMYELTPEHTMKPLLSFNANPRQKHVTYHHLNGAVYVALSEQLLLTRSFLGPDTLAYPMPRKRSLDIDAPEDLELLTFYLTSPPSLPYL